jgi:hypothetical protein
MKSGENRKKIPGKETNEGVLEAIKLINTAKTQKRKVHIIC